MRVATILFLLALLPLPAPTAQDNSLPRPENVVRAQAYVSLAPVPRGRPFDVAVVAEILKGFHINANKVLQDYLIPTAVNLPTMPGLSVLASRYPEGKLRKFPFSTERMSVYEGRVLFRLKLEAQGELPLGTRTLPVELQYQACNDQACLPPAKIQVPLQFEVVPAGTSSRPVHREIFGGRNN